MHLRDPDPHFFSQVYQPVELFHINPDSCFTIDPATLLLQGQGFPKLFRPNYSIIHQDLTQPLLFFQRIAQYIWCDLSGFQEHFTKFFFGKSYINTLSVIFGDIFNTNVVVVFDEHEDIFNILVRPVCLDDHTPGYIKIIHIKVLKIGESGEIGHYLDKLAQLRQVQQ